MTEGFNLNQISNPEDCVQIFSQAMPKGDIDTIMSLYEPGAIWCSLVSGHVLQREDKNFKKDFMWLTARNATVRFNQIKTVFHKDNKVALLEWNAVFEGHDPDGKEVIIPYTSHQVVRRQTDNTWKIVYEKSNRIKS